MMEVCRSYSLAPTIIALPWILLLLRLAAAILTFEILQISSHSDDGGMVLAQEPMEYL